VKKLLLGLQAILNLLMQHLRVSGSKAVDEISITTLQSFIAVTSNKLTNNFEGLVSSGLEPDVTCGSPVGLRWLTSNSAISKFVMAEEINFPCVGRD
jgi:hypothetical protein